MSDPPDQAQLRQQARQVRSELRNRDALSQAICCRIRQLAAWKSATTILFYTSVRDEVRTIELMEESLASGQCVIVPCCVGDDLELIQITSMTELVPGAYGIPEPEAGLRQDEYRCIPLSEIDLVLVPGVAFDRQGGRIGYGRGFYDRLLSRLPPNCLRVGLAFACQIVPCIPMQPHDQPIDVLICESETIECRHRRDGCAPRI
jgi:5-formyltetrahydrofolate cyclo-ligase